MDFYLLKRLDRDPILFEKYDKFMSNMIEQRYIEVVLQSEFNVPSHT